MRLVLLFVLLATTVLAACNPTPDANDPFRPEFLEACEGRVEYSSMKPKKRTAYCQCVYDRTMNGLSDNEKQVARFYLLGQVGIDVKSRNLISELDTNAMVTASKAIGDAVKQCR